MLQINNFICKQNHIKCLVPTTILIKGKKKKKRLRYFSKYVFEKIKNKKWTYFVKNCSALSYITIYIYIYIYMDEFMLYLV